MQTTISINSIYMPSEEIVSREIEGEVIIVPLTGGIGDMEDELYTLNETGKAIWDLLDGNNSLKDIAENLSAQFEAQQEEIEQDILGLMQELLRRRMIVEKKA
jgi:hypothetical protein